MTALRVTAVVMVAAVALRMVWRARWAPCLPRQSRPRRGWAVPCAAAVVVVATGSPWLLLVGAAAVASPWLFRGPMRRRTERRIDAALPGALDAVVRSLRAGASLRQALADAADEVPGRLGDDLRRVVVATRAGLPLDEALAAWGQACPRPGVLLVGTALAMAAETGGASAKAVEGVAATLRRRQAAEEETLTLSAQARASAVVLAAAPVVVCAFTVVVGGGAARFLLGTTAGLACLTVGLALNGVGWWWMTRLTNGVVGR